jgi:cellulose synthase/poly-beta-1,6-N-acetylglucosamine synthase-like glycosyltransferase
MTFSAVGVAIHGWWAWRFDGWASMSVDSGKDASLEKSCTVVVCLHNEEARVAALVTGLSPALEAATNAGLNASVVAVNHGSTDGTSSALAAATHADPRWNIVHVPRSRASKKEALVAGVDAAQGDVLVVTDADCAPTDVSWLIRMTQGAGAAWDVNVGLSFPSCGMTFLQRLQRLEARRVAQKAVGAIVAGRPYLGFGRNMAFTRDMWNRVGGMEGHNHLPSGDDDLWLQAAVKQGARVRANVHLQAQTNSTWPSTWRAWRRQKTRHFTASKAYPAALQFRLGLPALGWLLLFAGVVHNPTGTSVGLAALALTMRTLTFGMFLHRAGQPWREAWELVLEPFVSAFRTWAWWKGTTSESTSWK